MYFPYHIKEELVMKDYIKKICVAILIVGEFAIFKMSTYYAENRWNGEPQIGGFYMFLSHNL